MEVFNLYLKLGFEHICDLAAYDHMLFLLALIATYTIKEFRAVVLLATSFTIGHSITLALSVFDIFRLPSEFVEFCIPLTIIISGLYNLFEKKEADSKISILVYLLALFFGLIHGLGFSNFLRSILMPGEGLGKQLFSFNLGIELGQILIVIIFLLVHYIFVNILKISQKIWVRSVSILAIFAAIKIIIDLF